MFAVFFLPVHFLKSPCNAVKYTEKGSVTFSIKFKRAAEDSENIILLASIKDTGIGIKPENMKRFFAEFERIEEERNRNVEVPAPNEKPSKKFSIS